MARLSPTMRLIGATFRKLQADSKCQLRDCISRVSGRMDSTGDERAFFASTPELLATGAVRSSKVRLQYQAHCERQSVFVGDTSDPTRKCDFEPPSFDQKTINEPPRPVVPTAVSPKPAKGQKAADR
jgi:hypothetical protein